MCVREPPGCCNESTAASTQKVRKLIEKVGAPFCQFASARASKGQYPTYSDFSVRIKRARREECWVIVSNLYPSDHSLTQSTLSAALSLDPFTLWLTSLPRSLSDSLESPRAFTHTLTHSLTHTLTPCYETHDHSLPPSHTITHFLSLSHSPSNLPRLNPNCPPSISTSG